MNNRVWLPRGLPSGWVVLSHIAMGAVPGLIQVVFNGMGLRGFRTWALTGSVYSLCIGLPCWQFLPQVMRALADRSLVTRVAAGAGFFAVFGVAGCFVANLILLVCGLMSMRAFGSIFWWTLRVSLAITFSFGTLTLTIAVLKAKLDETTEELHRQQIAEERHSKILAEARYASLESRVHPHFLFNTLNSISALIRENPAEAERMVERLSVLLRYSLDSERAGLVPLADELRVVREYLAIEQVRFGARLRYRLDAEEAAASRLVPALSVQTLVENSVKYAVGAARGGAEIVITARLEGGLMKVEVSDDGPGFDPAVSLKPGHGLDLLRRRLESLFGAAALLQVNAANGRTSVAFQVAAA